MIKIKLFKNKRPDSWKSILRYQELMRNQGIVFVNNINQADILIFTIDGGITFPQLSGAYKQILFNSRIPVIIAERLASSITWFREFDLIPNLKAVFKNKIVRPATLNNSALYERRYHYKLLYDVYRKNILEKFESPKQRSKTLKSTLTNISEPNLNKVKLVIWDWHSSFISEKCNDFRHAEIDYSTERGLDVFCVNRDRRGIQGWARNEAKRIVRSMKNIVSSTDQLSEKEYYETFIRSKVCVGCWGYGEWVYMDTNAFYAGVVLIKPDTNFVSTYPDLYQNNKTYIPCKPDFSDLEPKIRMVLDNYECYKPMLVNNRNMLKNITQTDLVDRFCEAIKDSLK